MLSQRIQNLAPSPTLSLNTKVGELKAKGIPVVNLTVGQPDFKTPKNICESAKKAIDAGFHGYTPASGFPDLREAIVKKFKDENGIDYEVSEVMSGVGAKEIIYNALQTLIDPGDEVIVYTPTWTTYIEQIRLAGGKEVLVELDRPFKLTAEDVKPAISSKTKALILNSPSNPTGAIIDEEELLKIGDLAVENNFYILADEMYEKLLYKGEHVSIASLKPEFKNKVLTINGVSKAYAMTGWRLGYVGGPKEIIKGMISLEGQMSSNTSAISQKAGVEAILGDQNPVEEMRLEFEKRKDFLMENLSKVEGLEFSEPEGAFYFFVSVKNLLNEKYPTSASWCEGLLEEEKIAVVPGEAFEAPGYFRMSFAASMDDLQKAVEGIGRFVKGV